MKYLQIEAIKEDRRRGVLNDAEMKRLVRKSMPVTQWVYDIYKYSLKSTVFAMYVVRLQKLKNDMDI